MAQVSDGTTTYLAGDWGELAELVEEDEEFDFSVMPEADLVLLFEAGQWWDKENRLGVARLKQQVLSGAVDYFMYDGRRTYRLNGKKAVLMENYLPKRERVCFTTTSCVGTSRIHYFQQVVEGGLSRAPRELLAPENVEECVADLRLGLERALDDLIFDGCSMRIFALDGWSGCSVVSDGQAYRDWDFLRQRGVKLGAHHNRRLGSPLETPSALVAYLDRVGHSLIELVDYVPGLVPSPLRLLPSLAAPKSWSECVTTRGKVSSSFLIATPELLDYLDGSPVGSP